VSISVYWKEQSEKKPNPFRWRKKRPALRGAEGGGRRFPPREKERGRSSGQKEKGGVRFLEEERPTSKRKKDKGKRRKKPGYEEDPFPLLFSSPKGKGGMNALLLKRTHEKKEKKNLVPIGGKIKQQQRR